MEAESVSKGGVFCEMFSYKIVQAGRVEMELTDNLELTVILELTVNPKLTDGGGIIGLELINWC